MHAYSIRERGLRALFARGIACESEMNVPGFWRRRETSGSKVYPCFLTLSYVGDQCGGASAHASSFDYLHETSFSGLPGAGDAVASMPTVDDDVDGFWNDKSYIRARVSPAMGRRGACGRYLWQLLQLGT